MKSISKPRDTQDTNDKKEKELNEKVEQFFNDVRIELKFCDDVALDEFEKMVNDLKSGKTELDFTINSFEIITKFYLYEESKEKIIKIFCNFIQNLVAKRNLVKPIEVIHYENFLKGIDLIKNAIGYTNDDTKYRLRYEAILQAREIPKDNDETPFYTFFVLREALNDYLKFKGYYDDFLKYETQKSTEKIKKDFNTQLYALAKLYQLPISENTYKRTLSNQIKKYLIPNEEDE
ncbi:hypothetical protein [Campylobacter ureolyticus]|uniref:hypothetical protein n=1 Tax=Campylobacter ureolyticus TaxID=827 RepID=UPI0022B58491|nr:hypothetical protein [Campylobacter ureolyticus]MCZ6135539.1 hypothetical protein [Campylobacter ureolyticus]